MPNGPLGRGLVYDRNLSKQELRRGDYPWRVIGDFCNEWDRDISVVRRRSHCRCSGGTKDDGLRNPCC